MIGKTLFEIYAAPVKPCPACYGSGTNREAKDSDSMMETLCPACGGTGFDKTESKPSGETRKEVGIAKRNKSHSAALLDAAFDVWILNQAGDCSCDDFRLWLNSSKFAEACSKVHPNSFGALFNRKARAGRIIATGRFESSRLPSAHSRKVQVWEVR